MMSEKTPESCPEWETILHCYVDDELDAVHTIQFEQHLATCPQCTAALEGLKDMKRVVGRDGVKWKAPDEVRARIMTAISLEEARRQAQSPETRRRENAWWRGLQVFGQWSFIPSMAALAATLMLVLGNPQTNAPIQNELLASHVRSMLANHLVDVQTSDQHAVKPWFNGKIDFSPPVVDLAADGFPLIGGRVDYINGRVVAALVYRRHGHVINLFVWPGAKVERSETMHDGYNLVEWSGGGLVFWAVSDVSPPDLAAFRDHFSQAAGL